MESRCSSITKQGWIRIQNRRCGCGLKAELKIIETINNPSQLLFRYSKGACRVPESWKIEDDEKYFSENKRDCMTRFNYEKIENKTEIMLLIRLVALEESNGFNNKLLYALFVFLLALVLLLIVK